MIRRSVYLQARAHTHMFVHMCMASESRWSMYPNVIWFFSLRPLRTHKQHLGLYFWETNKYLVYEIIQLLHLHRKHEFSRLTDRSCNSRFSKWRQISPIHLYFSLSTCNNNKQQPVHKCFTRCILEFFASVQEKLKAYSNHKSNIMPPK